MICIWSCLPRQFGTKCSGCLQGISPSDLVRHARAKVFHLKCFTCATCRKQLSTGEELFVINENQFVCKEDYLNGSSEYIIKSIMKFLYFSMEYRYLTFGCATKVVHVYMNVSIRALKNAFLISALTLHLLRIEYARIGDCNIDAKHEWHYMKRLESR